MRLFDCHEKADVAHCLVEIVLEFLAPGDFLADPPCGACPENGGEDGARADDDGTDDLWVHGWFVFIGFRIVVEQLR